MRRLAVFNSVSLDGYFTDNNGDMSWAHRVAPDPEWNAFTAGNAQGGGTLLFGRITYDLMTRYWPTPLAMQQMPVVAERMNNLPKVVFSRTLDQASWNNTRLVRSDPAEAIRRMKQEAGDDMVILGSGSIVSQLSQEGLIDEYQIVMIPLILGAGRTMFEGIKKNLTLKLESTRAFANGNVFARYRPCS